ncbi:amidase [Gemmobacter sp. 24YEA27]|uniref:amidase n=1 Tax=Gemmobacter sp. 24YEA27 TaxID=3040672 RepID=UPI0024B3C3E0|nr:amidase [Gemmobacter sp. 24YEA27]
MSFTDHFADCQARILADEAQIRAFSAIDYGVLQAELDNAPTSGALAGRLIGVKDIIDARPYTTSSGSPLHQGRKPAADAAAVAQLRAAGAVIAGKTVTTEFAFFSPGPTRNPHDLTRTPGGSSSGSAAAVACGFVDIALGSQTAASITRPASYCGVVGFKPGFGSYSLVGVGTLAPSFDTLGLLAADVRSLAEAHAVLAAPVAAKAVREPRPARRIGLCRTPWWDQAEDATRQAIQTAGMIFAAEAEIVETDLEAFADGARLQADIMAYEAAQSLFQEMQHADMMSPVLHRMLVHGSDISRAEHLKNLCQAEELRLRMAELIAGFDILLAPAAPGEAPVGLASTGDPVFSRLWSLLRLPSITLPGLTGRSGLPVGVQLLSASQQDEELLGHALWAERLLPDRPRTKLRDIRQKAQEGAGPIS